MVLPLWKNGLAVSQKPGAGTWLKLVENLPSKHEALSSNLTPPKKAEHKNYCMTLWPNNPTSKCMPNRIENTHMNIHSSNIAKKRNSPNLHQLIKYGTSIK
jgi:hypothetical protein